MPKPKLRKYSDAQLGLSESICKNFSTARNRGNAFSQKDNKDKSDK
jgi:hypothetical protein